MNGNASVFAAVGDDILLRPLIKTQARYYWVVLFLLALIGWGAYAFFTQIREGLGVTGLNRPTFWGVYLTNFVFFIGISHAGTLISAILRVAKAEWRRPITRSAEAITVFALCIGAPQVLIDLGRVDRIPNILINSRFESPLLWDVCCIFTYFTASVTYLWLPMIPDLAVCRDRLPSSMQFRKAFYTCFALGWRGTPKQKHALERAIGIMAVVIIPVAVSVHTVVAFIFSMTIQPMWHSTVLGPYFVIGAIFTGIASLLIAMAILRKVYHLEDYLKLKHFDYLGRLLIVMVLLWAYATLAEYLTTFYGAEPAHMSVFYAKFAGSFAPVFWTMVLLCLAIPLPILAFRRTRTITGTVIAAVAINVGMWLERYTIVVPTLTSPRLPYRVQVYQPTWVEVGITVASFAMLFLLYAIFVKFFPIVSIWEVQEGRELAREKPATEAAASPDDLSTVAGRAMSQPAAENKLYFRLHMLLVVIGVSCYLTAIAWLIWRIVLGGGFELALGLMVIGVLLCVMLTACGTAAVIALEGRAKKSKLKPAPAHQPGAVSASRWTIRSPLERPKSV